LAELEQQKAKNLEAAARAADAAFRDQMLAALGKSEWAVAYGLLTQRKGMPIESDVATALQNAWEPFLAWTVAQSSTIGAYFELWPRLSTVPTGHSIRM